MRGLSLVAASGGHSSSRCAGLSLLRPLLLRSTGSRRAGSVVVAHRPSCSAACGIFPDQGSNPCPPHWQADSQPLRHQGSPNLSFIEHFELEVTETTSRNIECIGFIQGLKWCHQFPIFLHLSAVLATMLASCKIPCGGRMVMAAPSTEEKTCIPLSNPSKRLTTHHWLRLGTCPPLYQSVARALC